MNDLIDMVRHCRRGRFRVASFNGFEYFLVIDYEPASDGVPNIRREMRSHSLTPYESQSMVQHPVARYPGNGHMKMLVFFNRDDALGEHMVLFCN